MEQLTKMLNTVDDVRNEIEYLKKCRINVYNGYYGKKEIIINLTSNKGKVYVISYLIKGSSLYSEFRRYLRKCDSAH